MSIIINMDQLVVQYSKRLNLLGVNPEVLEAQTNVKQMLQSCRTLLSEFYFLTDSLVIAQGIVLMSEGDTFLKQKLVKTQIKALQSEHQKVLPELSKHQIEHLVDKELQQPKNHQAVKQLIDCFNVRTITEAVQMAHAQDQGISIQVNQKKSGRSVIQYQAITDRCHTLYLIVQKAKDNLALVCCYKFMGAQSNQKALQNNQGISKILDTSPLIVKAIIVLGLIVLFGVAIYQLTLDYQKSLPSINNMSPQCPKVSSLTKLNSVKAKTSSRSTTKQVISPSVK